MPLAKYCERHGLSASQIRDLHEREGFPLKKIGKNFWVSPLAVLNWYESYEEGSSQKEEGKESGRDGDTGLSPLGKGEADPLGEQEEAYRDRRRVQREQSRRPKGRTRSV